MGYRARLKGIPKEVAMALKPLSTKGRLSLEENPWGEPPAEVVSRGLDSVIAYWDDLASSGAIVSWKLKVVLVGAVKAGKTSLAKGMMKGTPDLCDEDDRTKGVDVHVSKPCKPDAARSLELIFWDFAGHSEYYSTHQIFLSKGALHLLVVNLRRFSEEPSVRNELVDMWLDVLQCRVPGSHVLVIATQIDRFTDDYEEELAHLKRKVKAWVRKKHSELESVRINEGDSASCTRPSSLVIHGVETVSSTNKESLLNLRSNIAGLVYSVKNAFPSVGEKLPVSWARVFAMLEAKRSGNDVTRACRLKTRQSHGDLDTIPTNAGQNFMHRAEGINEWSQVLRTLKLGKEVGSSFWGRVVWALKQSSNSGKAVFEVRGKLLSCLCALRLACFKRSQPFAHSLYPIHVTLYTTTEILGCNLPGSLCFSTSSLLKWDGLSLFFYSLTNQDAIKQLVQEGSILDSGEILYLKPTWISKLFQAILDHDLDNESNKDLWEDELQNFSEDFSKNLSKSFSKNLSKNFSKSTVVFRDLSNIHNNFPSTGILTVMYLRFLWRNVPGMGDEKLFKSLLDIMSHHGVLFQENHSSADDGDPGLFVPLNLPSEVLEIDLEEFAVLLKRQFRNELVYEMRNQTLIPPGLLGMLMARFLYQDARFHKCWSRGAAFTLGAVPVLLYLDSPSDTHARITANVFGEKFTDELHKAVLNVERVIESLFEDRFSGIYIAKPKGSPRIVEGEDAVIEKIDGLKAHINKDLSDVVKAVHQLETNLKDVTEACQTMLSRISCLRSKDLPFPSLVIVRPAAAVTPGKRSLKAMFEGLGRRAKKLVVKDLRLCFLCPVGLLEVPCGLDGNGYPFPQRRGWVKDIFPVLKVRPWDLMLCEQFLSSSRYFEGRSNGLGYSCSVTMADTATAV